MRNYIRPINKNFKKKNQYDFYREFLLKLRNKHCPSSNCYGVYFDSSYVIMTTATGREKSCMEIFTFSYIKIFKINLSKIPYTVFINLSIFWTRKKNCTIQDDLKWYVIGFKLKHGFARRC